MKKQKLYYALSGAFVGFLNGFFGGGGGMVVLPIFTMLFGFEQKRAHATAIAVILPITIISAITYLITGGTSVFNFKLLLLTIGVVLGGIIGALLLKKLKNKYLNKIFAILMFVAGVKLAFF